MARPRKLLIFGATSAIAHQTARLFARDGASFYLCGRNEERLLRNSKDLLVRGAASVFHSIFDALDSCSITNAIDNCLNKMPDLDTLLIAHGSLPNQQDCASDVSAMRETIDINFTSAAIILTHIAKHFEERGEGNIAVICSVAGDRGRKSNYVYGASKGALSVFLSGLRQRFCGSGVSVITIKPGFVNTPMTADFEKGRLFVGPEVIAKGIYEAVAKGKNVVYLPWFWRWIMMIIKSIPEEIFKRMDL